MGRKSMVGKPHVLVQLGQTFKKNYNFFKFQFEMALNGYLHKFCTRISLHLPREALNALRKIQFTRRNEGEFLPLNTFWKN